jgi:hypothetical protein
LVADESLRLNYILPAALNPTILIVAARLAFGILLVAVQAYVLRAIIKVIRIHGFAPARERLLANLARVLILVVNIPLAEFLLESLVSPRALLLYNPSARAEGLGRVLAYVFFVWNVGSVFFAAIAPVTMAAFALVQFVRRSGADRNDPTIETFDITRRRFLRMALTAAAAMPFAISAYGAVAARSRRVVERVVVPISDLPDQLDGLTIVQMSDIHAGVFMTETQMSDYVQIANDLQPDLVALTGDFVSSNSSQVLPFMRAMSKLQAKLGVFACLGNHDMFTHAEYALKRGFEEAGFRLLRNENHYIDIAGARLNVIGLDFFLEGGWRRVDNALKPIPRDGTTILLLHAPQGFPSAADMGVHLTLSGHTHGGQIALKIGELILTPALLSTMFLAGLFKIGGSYLYVNRGLGTTGPPIRINAPPEITHITLKRA